MLPPIAGVVVLDLPHGSRLTGVVEIRALDAVVRAPPTNQPNLKATNVELPSAVPAAREISHVAGRHWALAMCGSATTTVFLPAAFAR